MGRVDGLYNDKGLNISNKFVFKISNLVTTSWLIDEKLPKNFNLMGQLSYT